MFQVIASLFKVALIAVVGVWFVTGCTAQQFSLPVMNQAPKTIEVEQALPSGGLALDKHDVLAQLPCQWTGGESKTRINDSTKFDFACYGGKWSTASLFLVGLPEKPGSLHQVRLLWKEWKTPQGKFENFLGEVFSSYVVNKYVSAYESADVEAALKGRYAAKVNAPDREISYVIEAGDDYNLHKLTVRGRRVVEIAPAMAKAMEVEQVAAPEIPIETGEEGPKIEFVGGENEAADKPVASAKPTLTIENGENTAPITEPKPEVKVEDQPAVKIEIEDGDAMVHQQVEAEWEQGVGEIGTEVITFPRKERAEVVGDPLVVSDPVTAVSETVTEEPVAVTTTEIIEEPAVVTTTEVIEEPAAEVTAPVSDTEVEETQPVVIDEVEVKSEKRAVEAVSPSKTADFSEVQDSLDQLLNNLREGSLQ